MELIKLRNIWNVQYIAGHIDARKDIDNSFMVHQSVSKPINPDGLSLTETENVAIFFAEKDNIRVSLWVYAPKPVRDGLVKFVQGVYEDAEIGHV